MEKKLETKMIELNNNNIDYINSILKDNPTADIDALNRIWMIQQITGLQLQIELLSKPSNKTLLR